MSWVSDRALPTTRGASDPRFRVRRFGPLSQQSGPKPGMGQVPSSGTAGLIVFSSGEMEAANLRIAAHRSEKQSGTSIRRPSGGWLSRGFPGSPALVAPPTTENSKFKRLQRFFCRCWVLSGSALTDHKRRALLRATDPETRRLWLLSLTHTTNTTSPPNNGRRSGPERVRSSRRRVHVGRRPCVVVGGLPVPRSRTPTTRCRAGAYATGITPGVCVRALDVHGRGCAGDGLLQRRDDRRQRTHERKAGPAE